MIFRWTEFLSPSSFFLPFSIILSWQGKIFQIPINLNLNSLAMPASFCWQLRWSVGLWCLWRICGLARFRKEPSWEVLALKYNTFWNGSLTISFFWLLCRLSFVWWKLSHHWNDYGWLLEAFSFQFPTWCIFCMTKDSQCAVGMFDMFHTRYHTHIHRALIPFVSL
jgi:hypothetical protein